MKSDLVFWNPNLVYQISNFAYQNPEFVYQNFNFIYQYISFVYQNWNLIHKTFNFTHQNSIYWQNLYFGKPILYFGLPIWILVNQFWILVNQFKILVNQKYDQKWKLWLKLPILNFGLPNLIWVTNIKFRKAEVRGQCEKSNKSLIHFSRAKSCVTIRKNFMFGTNSFGLRKVLEKAVFSISSKKFCDPRQKKATGIAVVTVLSLWELLRIALNCLVLLWNI